MKNLQDHVRWFIRAQWAMGAFMLALLVVFYVIGFRPQSARLRQLQAQISRRQYDLRESQAKTRILPAVAIDVRNLRQQLDASKVLPQQEELPQFLKDIAVLGQHYSLRSLTFKQGMPSRSDLFTELPINLSFEGNYLDAFKFLRSTEQMQRLTRIRNMTIKTTDAQLGVVAVQLSMNIYFAPQ
jgi:Tfp pilus assembly protein PilO